jgi:hypothetical protein
MEVRLSKKKSDIRRTIAVIVLGVLLFSMMMVSAFLGGPNTKGVKISKAQHMAHPPIDIKVLTNAVNPPDGYVLPVSYGQIGPRLLEAGVIDIPALKQNFLQTGLLFSDNDEKLLVQGSQEPIIIKAQNASFLFTLFWGLGLSNQNPIMDKAPIQQANQWKVGKKPGLDLISRAKILQLSADQQVRVEEFAKEIYRPCNDASSLSPDNKYSVAMFGLLEYMVSQNVSSDTIFTTAKQVNAFWFPKQTLEQAIFFVATQLKDYNNVDSRLIVGQEYFSATGFQQLHQWLKDNGMLADDADTVLQC